MYVGHPQGRRAAGGPGDRGQLHSAGRLFGPVAAAGIAVAVSGIRERQYAPIELPDRQGASRRSPRIFRLHHLGVFHAQWSTTIIYAGSTQLYHRRYA